MEKTFSPALHAFRAFAIINIVAIHAFGFIFELAALSDNAPEDALRYMMWTNGNLLHDSTLYFTIISGILFTKVLATKGFSSFFQSKIKYVLLPYLFFTVLFTYRQWNFDGSLTVFEGGIFEFVKAVIMHLISGEALFTFWYIPILILLYLATPLLYKLLFIKKALVVNVTIMALPLVLSRAWPDFSWATFMYFLGAYMLGMYVGAYYHKSLLFIKRYMYAIVFVALVSTVLIQYLISINSPIVAGINLAESVWYIQKLAFSALALLVFERYCKQLPSTVNTTANYAFAIYFIHGYLLFDMHRWLKDTGIQFDNVPIILLFAALNLLLSVLICVVLTYILKRVLGNKSRFIIGA